MKSKDLLKEWKYFLNKEMLKEIKFKEFKTQFPNFDTAKFNSQIKGNTDYLDIIKNSIKARQNHNPDDYLSQFEYYINSIAPHRHNNDFLTINVPGQDDPVTLTGKVNPGACTATYNDIQQFQQARMFVVGKGSKQNLINAYVSVLEKDSELDFEKILENDSWIVFYPKSIRGSIVLARSYWDGNKLSYDETFNSSKGFGKNTGRMNWCTSVSGEGNMFLNYHRQKNQHMYYCINKNPKDLNDISRKLCISFSKKNNVIEVIEDHSTVNAENIPISQDQIENILGPQIFSVLEKDVESESRQEINEKSYYRSISYEQYLTLRHANENNIEDFYVDAEMIAKHSKDKEKIIDSLYNDNNKNLQGKLIAARYTSDKEKILMLCKSNDVYVLQIICKRPDVSKECIEVIFDKIESDVNSLYGSKLGTFEMDYVYDLKNDVLSDIAKHVNTPDYIINKLCNSKVKSIRSSAARRCSDVSILLSLTDDDYPEVYRSLALNKNSSPKVLRIITKKEPVYLIDYVLDHPNITDDILNFYKLHYPHQFKTHKLFKESLIRQYIKLAMS